MIEQAELNQAFLQDMASRAEPSFFAQKLEPKLSRAQLRLGHTFTKYSGFLSYFAIVPTPNLNYRSCMASIPNKAFLACKQPSYPPFLLNMICVIGSCA